MMLNIPLLNGDTWTVRAKVIGDLTIHRNRAVKGGWSVTHVPTLQSMTSAAPHEVRRDQGRLLAWADAAQANATEAWAVLRTLTRPVDLSRLTDAQDMARKQVFQQCKGVRV